MKITTKTVEKLTITEVERLDPINAIFEDCGEKRGKVTIEVCGDAWSYFWGNTGCETIKYFIREAGTDYLVGKFKIGIKSTLDDESQEALIKASKKYLIKERRSFNLDKSETRSKWEHIDYLDDHGISSNAEELHVIFGDEWWYDIPQKPNPEYNYLYRIVRTIQQALALEKV